MLSPALESEARQALAAWGLADAGLSRLPGGLINQSLLVAPAGGVRAVLQRLHPVFPPEVNDNIECLTDALAAQGTVTPRLLRTQAGATSHQCDGAVWRLLSHVDGHSVQSLQAPAEARAAGELLGRFHAALAHWDGTLPHVRPGVHVPSRHFQALREALDAHGGHRLHPAIAALAHEILAAADAITPWPEIPVRLVHGDPKISNLLFDAAGRGLCLVDLDTLARGPLVPELGDAFRSWCNPGPEDADEARFDLALFAAAIEGYAVHGRQFLHAAETVALVDGTRLIYLELAARFAADALHERYFGWDDLRYPARGEHNLARARNQWQAACSLAHQSAAAREIVLTHLG